MLIWNAGASGAAVEGGLEQQERRRRRLIPEAWYSNFIDVADRRSINDGIFSGREVVGVVLDY